MSEETQRKDLADKIDTLTLEVAKGFARNDALGEGINRRLDTLNGKVAEHERTIRSQEVKDAVNADRVSRLQDAENGRLADGKRAKWLTIETAIGFVAGLLGTGLIALITFYLTYKR